MVATKERNSQSATPLTRCSNCLTVFEVPVEVLQSSDTRVRCGECLGIFDALRSIHRVKQEDFVEPQAHESAQQSLSVNKTAGNLSDQTSSAAAGRFFGQSTASIDNASAVHNDGPAASPTSGQSDSLRRTANDDQSAATALSSVSANAAARRSDLGDGLGDGQGDGQEATRNALQGAGDRAPPTAPDDLDVTFADFDLFSDEAEIPEHVFLDETRDATQLNFEQVPSHHDETLSDTLFANDVTRDVSLDVDSTTAVGTKNRNRILEQFDSRSTGPVERDAEVDFAGTATGKTKTVEFDYSDAALGAVSTQAQSVGSERLGVGSEDARFTGAGAAEAADAGVYLPANAEEARSARAKGKPKLSVVGSTKHNWSVEANNDLLAGSNGFELKSRRSAWVSRWLVRVALLMLAMLLVAGIYLFNQRNSLVDNPLTRPLVLGWCYVKGCEAPARFDADRLKLMSKNMYSHPDLENALVINVVLKNTASFEQRYPVLGVRLSDRTGRVVARRDFYPDDYLKSQNIPIDLTIAPNSAVDISFDIEDPGNNASSFIIIPH